MALEFQDYYETLGVSRDASLKDIQKAYRKLAQKYHPDVSKEAGAKEKFVKINEAQEVLTNPETRKKYDELGPRWKQGQGFEPPPDWRGDARNSRTYGQQANEGYQEFHFDEGADFSDFFEQFFAQGMRGGASGGATGGARESRSGRPSFKGASSEATIRLRINELYNQTTKPISLESREVDSAGNVKRGIKNYQVKIPPGTKSGSSIRLQGQGRSGGGTGQAGDLFLKVEIEPDNIFRVKDYDLFMIVKAMPWDFILGSSTVVHLPDGSTISVVIPRDSKGSRKLRVRGKGLPKNKNERGDLFVELQVMLPAHISEQEEKLWQELRAAHEASGQGPGRKESSNG